MSTPRDSGHLEGFTRAFPAAQGLAKLDILGEEG